MLIQDQPVKSLATTTPASRRISGLLLLFIIVKMIFQYAVLSPYYELHRDEYLHLDMVNPWQQAICRYLP
ncbi:hypothetical protein [Chitinophaga arvensicola]|uniref:hypothetical protein n=1 Tax=Chitinophaga arvensicola TaxID=29529 RepID=UPI0015A64F46|nr:hypothetical protein [Chitinophaga arvensicola]